MEQTQGLRPPFFMTDQSGSLVVPAEMAAADFFFFPFFPKQFHKRSSNASKGRYRARQTGVGFPSFAK